MKWFVYIIKSKTADVFYKGFTTDYLKRLEEHNSGISAYTSTRIPLELAYKIFIETFHEIKKRL